MANVARNWSEMRDQYLEKNAISHGCRHEFLKIPVELFCRLCRLLKITHDSDRIHFDY